MLRILATLAQLGGMQLVIALTGVARNKVLALKLGAAGYGEFNQIALLSLTASTIAGLGLSLSLNRNIAAAQEHSVRQKMLSQADTINIVLSGIILLSGTALIAFFPDSLRAFGIYPSRLAIIATLVTLWSVPVEVAIQHRLGFLIGMMDVKGIAYGRSAALLIGTALSLPVIWYLGLVGAALQLVITGGILVFTLDRRCRKLNFRPWHLEWSPAVLRTLVAIGLASLVSTFVQRLSDVYIRTRLINIMGAAENGLYQAALSVTYQVQAIVLGSIGSYLTATISSQRSDEEVSNESNALLRIILPVGAVFLGGLGAFAYFAIIILYSGEFIGALSLFPYLLVAEYLSVMVWVVGAPLLAYNRLGVWLGLGLFQYLLRALLAMILIPLMGTAGVASATLIAAALHLSLTWAYFVGWLKLNLSRVSIAAFARGLVATIGLGLLGVSAADQSWLYLIATFGLIAYVLLETQIVYGIRPALTAIMKRIRKGDSGD